MDFEVKSKGGWFFHFKKVNQREGDYVYCCVCDDFTEDPTYTRLC